MNLSNSWQRVWCSLSRPIATVISPPPPLPLHVVKTGSGPFRRCFTTPTTLTPRYGVSLTDKGVTPRVVKIEGLFDIMDKSASFNKNQHMFHEYQKQPNTPKHWSAGVWFKNGKPVVRKYKTYTAGYELESLRDIVPPTPIQIPNMDETAPANVTSNNAILMHKNSEESRAKVSTKQLFSSREYNSWLRSDVKPALHSDASADAQTTPKESIESTEMPDWYKSKGAYATSAPHADGPTNGSTTLSLRKFGSPELEALVGLESDYSAVPVWQWRTDFNAVSDQIFNMTGEANATSGKILSGQELGTQFSQIVVDFEKKRWLSLPARTHFLQPRKQDSAVRGFSTSSTSRAIFPGLLSDGKGNRYHVKSDKSGSKGLFGSFTSARQINTSRNNDGESVGLRSLDDVIPLILSPRSPAGGPAKEVVVRPPNVPKKPDYVKVKNQFVPVKDDVEVLPLTGSKGDGDEVEWWRKALMALAGVIPLYFLLAWYLSKDACPEEEEEIVYPEKEKDDPAPMNGKYETSLPAKMKDIKREKKVVFGRPQKDYLKTWSDIEKNWNTAGPNGTHRRAGYGGPEEGNARFGVADEVCKVGNVDEKLGGGGGGGGGGEAKGAAKNGGAEEAGGKAEGKAEGKGEGNAEEKAKGAAGAGKGEEKTGKAKEGKEAGSEAPMEMKLRRDANLRRNMGMEMGRVDKCKEQQDKEEKMSVKGGKTN